MGGLLGLEFVKREDINDANTFFTGYARIYTSTNCPDNLPGIIISFNINGVVFNSFFQDGQEDYMHECIGMLGTHGLNC